MMARRSDISTTPVGDREGPAASQTIAPSKPAVELRAVTKSFAQVVAVNGVSLVIPSGGFYSLLGPSGSGKTTCLRLIAGFEDPDEGGILIQGVPVADTPAYRRDVNTVFQHYALFPHMDVARNVRYGLKQRRPRIAPGEIDRRTSEILALVQLEGMERRRVWELSGGQQQRVAVARALVNRPQVLLLDEPLGALDLKLRKQMQLELKRIQHEVGITFIHVTHDQEEAMAMSDRIAIMVDGVIAQEGTPKELYFEPRTRFVADFVGECNFLDGRVVESLAANGRDGVVVQTHLGAHLKARLPVGARQLSLGRAATIAIRPEHVVLRPRNDQEGEVGPGGKLGTIHDVTFLGNQVQYEVHVRDLGDLLARVTGEIDGHDAGLSPGCEVSVFLDERACLAIEASPVDAYAGGSEPNAG